MRELENKEDAQGDCRAHREQEETWRLPDQLKHAWKYILFGGGRRLTKIIPALETCLPSLTLIFSRLTMDVTLPS